MLINKIILLFAILLISNQAYAQIFDFTGVTGTDLNVLYPGDWNSFSDSNEWYQKTIQNNGVFYIANNGVGGTTYVRLMNNDLNLSIPGQTITASFQLKDVNRIAGTDQYFGVRWLNATIDANLIGQIDIRSTSGDLNYLMYAGQSKVIENTANLDDYFSMIAIRKSNNFIYDFNFYVNEILVAQSIDVNINTDNFRTYLRAESNGPGTGKVAFGIDNLFGAPPATADVIFSNYQTYLGNFYVKDLNYQINYRCDVGVDANITRAINDVNNLINQLNCNNTLNSINALYTHSTEGLYNIKFFLFDTNTLNTKKIVDLNFISDLNAPTIDINFGSFSSGFNTSLNDLNVNQVCFDSISPSIHYDLNNETTSTNLLNANYPANSTQTVSSASISGINNFVGECVDLVGNNSTDTNSITISSVCFTLVNEENGNAFTTSDLNTTFTSFRAIAYSSGDLFNFMSPLMDNVCYSTPSDDVIRFDMNYTTGISIFKEFNINLMETFSDSNSIPVCVAPEQSLFTQDFLSSVQKPAIVRHTFWGCYGLGDYTKFSLQDALYHSTFTIDAPYDLFTYDENSLIQLGNIDGSTASTINLDILVLKSKDYIIDIITDSLSIYKDYNNTITFEYVNDKEDNLSSTIQIYDGGSVVFSSTNTASPNSYSIIWSIVSYDFQGHVLKAVITNTKLDGSIESENTYFTPDASSGILDPGLASIIAVLFFFFSFTLVAPKLGFNWFGLLVTIITIGILSLSPAVWFITFLQSIFAIIGLFTFLIYKDENIGYV